MASKTRENRVLHNKLLKSSKSKDLSELNNSSIALTGCILLLLQLFSDELHQTALFSLKASFLNIGSRMVVSDRIVLYFILWNFLSMDAQRESINSFTFPVVTLVWCSAITLSRPLQRINILEAVT